MSNAYDSTRGNTTDRARRKAWLLETFRADVDADLFNRSTDGKLWEVPLGEGQKACRCYCCGRLMTLGFQDLLTVDRIIPGCKGGTYRRNNIRPSCRDCANKQGGELSAENRRKTVPVVRPRVRQLAARDAQAGSGSQGTVPVPDVQTPGPGDLRRNGPVA